MFGKRGDVRGGGETELVFELSYCNGVVFSFFLLYYEFFVSKDCIFFVFVEFVSVVFGVE